MRMRSRRRHAGRRMLNVGAGGVGGLADGHTILTITDDGGIALATTAAPHGLTSGTDIVISGTSNAAYNVTTSAGVTTLSDTTFYFGPSYVGDATGGRWALA